ncbi:hypothetical protein ACN47E_006499 [Coniothyrium glycines]
MSSRTNGFAQGVVLKVTYSMLSLTSSVMLARVGLNFFRPKRLTASDGFIFIAFAFYVTMCGLYIAVSPYMQRVYGVVNGTIAPYARLEHDRLMMARLILIAFCMFWMTLWSVKISLLLLYRRLLVGMPRRYTIIWWSIVTICLVTHFGNYAMYLRSCGTLLRFWQGRCSGKSEHEAQMASLYYSFTVDTSTNLMIMALPLWLTWNLHMPVRKKLAIHLLFASGFICIAFACLRVAQVAINAAKPEADAQPLDPTWLAIWGTVECSVAVIIGCCPAFAILVNAFRAKATYDSRGYRRHLESHSGKNDGSRIQLQTIGSMSTRERDQKLGLETTTSHWADAHSSQEELRGNHDGILVLTTVTQDQGSVSCYKDP